MMSASTPCDVTLASSRGSMLQYPSQTATTTLTERSATAKDAISEVAFNFPVAAVNSHQIAAFSSATEARYHGIVTRLQTPESLTTCTVLTLVRFPALRRDSIV